MLRILMLLMLLVLSSIPIECIDLSHNAKFLCENSSGNSTEIVLEGDEIRIIRPLDYRIAGGRISILIDYTKHNLTFADIDKNSDRIMEGATRTSPTGNESSVKISGRNLKIIEPCNKSVDFGGIICNINFTSRRTIISSAW